MNNILAKLYMWCSNYITGFNDLLALILTILFGNIIKIYKEPEMPNKWRFTRFLSELLISTLIALTFYYANKYWFGLPYLFTLIICVWLGSLSNKIYEQADGLITWSVQFLKDFVAKKIMLFFLGFIITTGCKTSQPVVVNSSENTNKEIEKVIITNEIVKNQEIIDSLKIQISKIKTIRPECDSIANAEILKLLKLINHKKQSGNNNFGVYFDELKKELVAYAKISETKDKKIKELSNKLVVNSLKKQKEIPIKYIPSFYKWLSLFGGVAFLYGAYRVLKIFIL